MAYQLHYAGYPGAAGPPPAPITVAGPPGPTGATGATGATGPAGSVSASSSLTVGGTTITGFGSAIGQALGPLVSSGGANLPLLSTGNRLIFRRATPAVNDSEDFQFDRTTTFTGGSPSANINRVIGVNTNMGANDTTQTSGIIAIGTNNSITGGLLPNFWSQAIRTVNGRNYISAGVFSTDDQTDLSSGTSNCGNASTEIDHMVNGADDGTNGNRFGGVGVRSFMRFVGMRSVVGDTAPTEIATGLWITTGPKAFGSSGSDAFTSISQAIGFGVNTQIRSALDTRGAITPSGSSNPVSAVNMTHGHVIDFNGGAALDSAPGNYWWYDSGASRMKYNVGATTVFSIDASGNVRAAGTLTGSTTP